MRRCAPVALLLLTVAGCRIDQPPPLPPGTIAFGVFGDGPYRSWENGRFRRLLEDVDVADVEWLIHIGDILWYPCSDEAYADRLASLNSLALPVVYTPGDNEWADCHERVAGSREPLDRLAALRSIFFADPRHSVGGRPMALESQADDPAHAEFVENARWRRAGFLFVTVHVVGTGNGAGAFEGRTPEHDAEVVRRTAAALAWLDDAFAIAHAEGMHGVVVAQHADPGLDGDGPWRGFETLIDRLGSLAAGFAGPVLLIHGDSHDERVDQPLAGVANFSRLETFGSPEIGWVRVVLDTVAGRIVDYHMRRMPGGIPLH